MVGLIGGTFDPIHNGHIHLAVMLRESHSLDEVWFLPSLQNPLKEESGVPFNKRYKMVELATCDLPWCKVLPLESEREPPSYTIDTVKILKKSFPDKQFHLLLGDDHLNTLHEWKNVEELFEICPPFIGSRLRVETGEPKINSLIKRGITEIPLLQISSTWVRERLKNNLYCNHLVPPPVLDYIKQNRLYYFPYE